VTPQSGHLKRGGTPKNDIWSGENLIFCARNPNNPSFGCCSRKYHQVREKNLRRKTTKKKGRNLSIGGGESRREEKEAGKIVLSSGPLLE